jgi:hypothetical protein
LNNQFIWLLSDLGVSDKIFLQLQQQWFNKKPSISNYSELISLIEKYSIKEFFL